MLHMAEAKRMGTETNPRSESGKEGTGTERVPRETNQVCVGEKGGPGERKESTVT